MTNDKFAHKWLSSLLSTGSSSKSDVEYAVYRLYDLNNWPRPKRIVWCGSPVGANLCREAYCSANMTSVFSLLHSMAPSIANAVAARIRPGGVSLPNTAAYLNYQRVTNNVFEKTSEVLFSDLSEDRNRTPWWARNNNRSLDKAFNQTTPSEFMNTEKLFTPSWLKVYENEIKKNMPMFSGSISTFAMTADTDTWKHSLHSMYADAIRADYFWMNHKLPEQAQAIIDTILMTECVIMLNDIAFVSERKLVLNVNSSGQLHKDGGPALVYPDGLAFYHLNGIRVTKHIAETPGEHLDVRLVLSTKNADTRREIVKKIGAERVCIGLNAKCVDKWEEYELLMLDLGDSRRRPFLKMSNRSIDAIHIEGVHPDCDTVMKALAWRNGLDKFVEPEQLT